MERRRKETKEWEPWFTWQEDGQTMRCVYYGNTMQYKREQAFSYYGWWTKSTRAICSKAPRAVKQKFADCGGRVRARMDVAEMYGEGGEASAPAFSQSMHNNGGRANIIGIGSFSPAHNASSIEPSRVASSCTFSYAIDNIVIFFVSPRLLIPSP